eukprot:UN30310
MGIAIIYKKFYSSSDREEMMKSTVVVGGKREPISGGEPPMVSDLTDVETTTDVEGESAHLDAVNHPHVLDLTSYSTQVEYNIPMFNKNN